MNQYSFNEKRWLQGKERNAVRSMLRKALKAGTLQFRKTYYDYYDSCHAPEVTPDAMFQVIEPSQYSYWVDRLKAGPHAPSVYLLPDGTYEISTSYSTYNVCIGEPKPLMKLVV